MKIEHLALWVQDLEKMKSFYVTYFGAVAGEKYSNHQKKFESYFLRWKEGARLELMRQADVSISSKEEKTGWAHVAISVGSKEQVDRLTQRIKEHGFEVIGAPRTTGDGYYESVILDPEGNKVEITV